MAERSIKQRLLQGGLWVLIGKIVAAAASLIISALATRLLTPEEFGAFGLAFSMTGMAAMVAKLGLHQAVVRLVAESIASGRTDRARASIGVVFRFCAISIVAIVVLLLSIGDWLARGVWESELLAAAMGAIAAWTAMMTFEILTSETFRGFQDLRLASLFGGVITGIVTSSVLALVWLVRGSATLQQVVWISVAAGTASLLLALAVLSRKMRSLDRGFRMPAGEVLSISLPLWISGVTAMVLLRVDLWILGAYIPKEELGIYYAAWRLVNLVSMPLMLVILVVPPFIAELYAKGERRRLERILRNAATLGGLPAFGVLLLFVVFGGPVMGIVYTEEFRAGATLLAIMSLGKIVNVWTGSCGVTMSMTGYQSPLMVITVTASSLVVVGCLLVAETFGAIGVAVVVSGGLILQNLAQWLAARYYTGMWTHAGLPRPREIRALFSRSG